MNESLETVIADARSEAQTLRAHGHEAQALTLERFATAAERSAEPWLRWLSETDAAFRSGHSATWFRKQFGAWQDEGLAEMRGRVRFYRLCIVPRRANPSAAYEAGQRAARGDAA